jgi:hypothetical protein
MRHRAPARSLALALTLASLAIAPRARADKDPCISAYEQTQTLRKDGKIIAAKAQAAVCARESCPALLSKDCTRWLGDLEQSTPSVVFDARSASGAELLDVRVTVDGAPLVSRIDGKAVQVEPGRRTFRFETEGAPAVETMVVVREGEKNRRVRVVLATHAKAASRPVPAGVWIFGGASVVALATATVFTIDGLSRKSDLDQCKPRCNPDDVDTMSARFTMADVALGAGVAAGVAALYLFFTRPPTERTAQGPLPVVAPAPRLRGATLGLGLRF